MSKARALSNVEILNYFKDEPRFFNCISKDEMNQLKRGGCYIINMTDSTDQNMGHWIAVSDLNKEHCIYFDPFGAFPPTIIEKWMKKGKKQCIHSTLRIQNLTSILCGYYCIHVLKELLKDNSLDSFINTIFSMH